MVPIVLRHLQGSGERNGPGRADTFAKSHARNKKTLKFRWITNGLLIALSLQANERCPPLALSGHKLLHCTCPLLTQSGH